MRSPENVKIGRGSKAPTKIKGSSTIRHPIKKTYCTKCQRLIKGQVQNAGSTTQIACPRCGERLWFWKNLSWRSSGKGLDSST